LALALTVAAHAADAVHGSVSVAVIDSSGGVLPGVTVVAIAPGGGLLATAVTGATGDAVLADLPAGPVTLTFELEGFAPAEARVLVPPHAQSDMVQRLALARMSESVDVVAKAPDDPAPLLAPPAPTVVPVPVHDPDSVCGPAKAAAVRESFGTVRAPLYGSARGLYAAGDELQIDGGTLTGLAVGQNVVVRRTYHVDGAAVAGEHTSGLLQIVASDARTSVAVVIYACDEIMKGDYLAAFHPAPLRRADPFGEPTYDGRSAARVLFADAGQMLGVARRMMVIDRGSEQGIRAGQRMTLFRRRARGVTTPEVVGDAVVVAVRADSATIRVERAIDGITSGDWAAPQHPLQP
jgi:hypothetical protein